MMMRLKNCYYKFLKLRKKRFYFELVGFYVFIHTIHIESSTKGKAAQGKLYIMSVDCCRSVYDKVSCNKESLAYLYIIFGSATVGTSLLGLGLTLCTCHCALVGRRIMSVCLSVCLISPAPSFPLWSQTLFWPLIFLPGGLVGCIHVCQPVSFPSLSVIQSQSTIMFCQALPANHGFVSAAGSLFSLKNKSCVKKKPSISKISSSLL